MRILVVGGTGTVGSQVARELVARRQEVHVLTRRAEGSGAVVPGAHAVVGDLLDPSAVRRAFAGMEGVFLLNAVSATEAHEGLLALNGARLAGVGRIVYLSVQDAERAVHLPHFGSKFAIEEAIRRSGIAHTILRPNNYFQNDLWLREAIARQGAYPQPLGGAGVSRVDVRDIAELAAIALADGGHDGRQYDVVGPEALTGESTAAAWSRALGRPVAYAGDDLESYEQHAAGVLPAWMAFDFRLMYEYFQEHGLRATPGAVERLTAALGHAPRRFDDFAAETARVWKT